MIGTTISHYKILEKLGEGGMGIVYKAHDTRLDREVALKFLPHEISATDDERARFVQEARAAATLNHAHISTIYAIEESDGNQFISMEYVDGVTLRRKLNDSGAMKVDDVISLGVQIGDALHEAHARGIVHRDVKAENIMVNSRNQPKVMDFGLAKLKGSLKLTKTSSTVGTLAYMAPEQIQAGEVDARSDIFSFGVVLFEMLSGQTPFRGEHEAAMMYSILNEEPEPISKYLPDASPELLHIMNRALEKDPEDRYQSVHDMVIDLRRLKKDSSRKPVAQAAAEVRPKAMSRESVIVQIPKPTGKGVWIGSAAGLIVLLGAVAYFTGTFGPAAPEGKLTVAVTDFVNNTSEPELDGLSGMLITSMEQSKRLTVMTRARMFDVLKQMGQEETDRIDEDLGRQVAQTAGVSALISASIRKFGKLYTIDLKVLDPQKDEYIFTAKEEGEGQESIPGMLDKLSEKTRIGLKERADEIAESRQSIAEVTTSNLEAYQYFFEGEEHINRLRWGDAKEAFEKAVGLDSTFGVAWYRLAYAEGWNSEAPARSHILKAMEYIDQIPEREQFLVRAEAARLEDGMEASIDILKDMGTVYPEDKEMLFILGDYLYHVGDNTSATGYLTKVLEMDPTFERALQHLIWAYRDVGSYEQMLATALKYVSIAGSGDAYATLGDAYSRLGRHDQGIETLSQARKLFPESYAIPQTIAELYIDQGKIQEAQQVMRSIIAETEWGTPQRNAFFGLAGSYLYLGKYQEASRIFSEIKQIADREENELGAGLSHAFRGAAISRLFRDGDRGYREFEKAGAYPGYVSWPQADFFRVAMAIEKGGPVSFDMPMLESVPILRVALRSVLMSKKGDCNFPAGQVDSLKNIPIPELKHFTYYNLVLCWIEHSDYGTAMAFIQQIQSTGARSNIYGALSYPRSFFLMGRVYEGLGDRGKARESYEQFLEIWKDADKDLPDYIEANERLISLKKAA